MRGLYNIFEKHSTISIDSRDIAIGSMFFALKGENVDGNRYAADALKKGAAYAVVDDPDVAVSDKYILVENVLTTLQRLSTYHRRVLGIPILAITGSNGKTTTKELTTRVLSKRYQVASTQGNLNNHIGVPLTLLSFKKGVEFGIVEMGASARGEIEFLCSITQPDFGIITNIGMAHLEGFGSIKGIMQAKGELFDYLIAHQGLAFYLKESKELTKMVEERSNLLAKSYSVHISDGIKNNLIGEYNKYNIAAAATIGEYFGIIESEVEDAIQSYEPVNHRSQRVETNLNTLILDCYNANPTSMKAAIEDFAKASSWRNRVVILGDMLELGNHAAEEHKKILELLDQYKIRRIFLVGHNFVKASEGMDINKFSTTKELQEYLSKNTLKGQTILIKGSNSLRMNKLIEYL